MSAERAVRAAFADQAGHCERLGAPLTARVVGLVGSLLDRSTAVGRRTLDWPGDPTVSGDGLPLRLAGGLHWLVRAGALPGLAALYPPHASPSDAALEAALAEALRHPALPAWLDSAPQTNEVARSSMLMAGLTVLSRGRPFALHELGASAGLNLWPERYAHDLGGALAGDAASPVRLAPPDWQGPPPPLAPVAIARRAGVDLHPVDPRDPAQRERMLAYIWPDTPARLARAEAALAMAAENPAPVVQGDAADWLECELRLERGVCAVVWHSIAFQYFPEATRRRIETRLGALGAEASDEAPLAWLRLEMDPRHGAGAALLLTRWPGGEERLLATASPHLLWVRWRG